MTANKRHLAAASSGSARSSPRAGVTRRLLEAHATCGVPFKYSVMFLLKVHGHAVRDVQASARITSGGLHQALDGAFQPSDLLRVEMKKRLGLDPWKWQVESLALSPSARPASQRSSR